MLIPVIWWWPASSPVTGAGHLWLWVTTVLVQAVTWWAHINDSHWCWGTNTVSAATIKCLEKVHKYRSFVYLCLLGVEADCLVGVALTKGGVSGGAEMLCWEGRETRGDWLERSVSLWLEIRLLGSWSDMEEIESLGSSSPLILMSIYLSGMRPSLPPTQPLHQSELAWLYRVIRSPFMKLTSRELRAEKSYWAMASRTSDSVIEIKIRSNSCQHWIFLYKN